MSPLLMTNKLLSHWFIKTNTPQDLNRTLDILRKAESYGIEYVSIGLKEDKHSRGSYTCCISVFPPDSEYIEFVEKIARIHQNEMYISDVYNGPIVILPKKHTLIEGTYHLEELEEFTPRLEDQWFIESL